MTTIAFVDDYFPFRGYLAAYLETMPNGFKVHQYDSGEDFIARFPTENYTPDIVLMDICLPKKNGYDTTAWLKKRCPSIPVLAFSDLERDYIMVLLVECGANGYLGKGDCYAPPPRRLLEAMAQLMAGNDFYEEQELFAFVKKRLAMPKSKLFEGVESLSDRERSVVNIIDYRKTYAESAKELFISQEAYHSRLKSVLKKLGLSSKEALYDFAVKVGIRPH
jgi:DNA-binding NarL/FixJ family response regulator